MMTELFSADLSDAHRIIQQQAELVVEQKATIARQEATIRRLEERVVDLERQLDEAKRAGKRQATPFSKGQLVS